MTMKRICKESMIERSELLIYMRPALYEQTK